VIVDARCGDVGMTEPFLNLGVDGGEPHEIPDRVFVGPAGASGC
jgi:hypothetical protein